MYGYLNLFNDAAGYSVATDHQEGAGLQVEIPFENEPIIG